MKTEPNESSYPVHGGYMIGGDYDDPRNHTLQGGLTKREYFAAMAMQGMLANNDGAMTSGSSRSFHPDTIATCAVNQADALIEALNKEP